ncbi:MAG TPA: hypothetical protein IAB06_06195 [Candidatus Avacidaminococcus intestinavium]|uniref:ATP synthase I n=1 Tax=Candidatus Avacidaminococcus intestinavium TaxID=2840684 RepID=A0A9D1MQU6_9FIRM|nr:hypothetical protein [Candidatus Avacidaminococcus intestinavium]
MNEMVQEVLSSLNTVLFRHVCFSFLVIGVVFFLAGSQTALLWALGLLWGFIDTYFMFNGIKKGMKMSAEASLKEMQRTLIKRLFFAVALVFVMLKLDFPVLGLFMGFLLSHIFLLINLIIIAGFKRK